MARENQNIKKNSQIDALTAEDVLQDLKNRGLPTFGTNPERRDRLKKHYGKFMITLIDYLGVDHVPGMLAE